ncbi:HD domain-containing protein [Schleiferiaceae bacterium]|jgi:guanosine-3',5'-bis(diphosphate) 3'-pyrophosphohydrolase|nr:HD domain-containing protein [Schleiferiaceae bacterium]
MTTQSTFQKAMKFAAEAHAQQTVPGSSANYLLHISNVVMEIIMAHHNEPTFDLEFAIQVGALHDVLEDVEDITEEVLQENFSIEVVEAVKTLTKDDRIKDKELKLLDSLDRIASSKFKEASIVKLADRITNLQPPPPHWSQEKCEAYAEQARKILTQLGDANQYLAERLNELTILYQERIR